MAVGGKLINLKTGKGYFVGEGKTGILVLHGWWGLDDFFKRFSDDLSKEGFSVLALDLYHGQVANDVESAKRLRGSVDRPAAHDEIKSAISFLREKSENRLVLLASRWEQTTHYGQWIIVIKMWVLLYCITVQAEDVSVKQSRQF